MAVTCLLFAVGIILVVKGGDIFVDAAGWIAKALRIPTFIIGATIVSLATTLPEMIVSMIAASQGQNDMAIGNAVGSVTANTGLIMAIAMLFMGIACSRKQYLKQCLCLVAAAVILLFSCRSGTLNMAGAAALVVVFVFFMYLNIRNAKSDDTDAGVREEMDKKQLGKNIAFFVAAAVAIAAGSQLMVDNGSEIAAWLGVPERVIAITLVAIGTSLPELVTTITAIIKKESALSVGNIIGANIIDLTLILPLCSLVSGKALPVSVQSADVDIPVCLGVILIAIVPLMAKEKSNKIQGGLLLACYLCYLAAVL